MSIEHKYKKLDEIDHMLLRPGRYIGSITPHTAEVYAVDNKTFSKQELTWNPAFLKLFDEIITNSVDHSKTADGSHLNTIKVNLNQKSGVITIWDNGGMPVVKHKEHDQYIPELVFELRAGSNFNDDEHDGFKGGTHGEGAAAVNIMSLSFSVNTADGKNKFSQVHTGNSRIKTTPIIKKSKEKFTQITYMPDYVRFGMDGLDDGNYQKLIKRVYDVAGCNPQLTISVNDEPIVVKSFEDYIKLYTDDYLYDHNENWHVGISKSDGSFSHVSFVNGVETTTGGQHITYITDQLVSKLREYITKKHKINVKPTEIKNHLNLFIQCNIMQPKYSSQTKEDMITEIKNFGTSFEISEKFIKKVIASEIVQSILDWVQTKENALLQAELRKLNKNADKSDPSRIVKFHDAVEKRMRHKCTLFIVEGDSANLAIKSAREPQYHASFALKGKPINVSSIKPSKLMENDEFKNLLTIIGLKLGEKVTDLSQLRFGKICILTDQDCITNEHYVLTNEGDKLISDIVVGDMVLTHTNEFKPVSMVSGKQSTKIIRLSFNGQIKECTPEHKIPVLRDGTFKIVHASDVFDTDKLFVKSETNRHAVIDSIELLDKEILCYDLTVDDDHTFYVRHRSATDYVLTHNCDGIHINGLLINMLQSFWPELFKLGVIYRFNTPLIKAFVGKEVLEFYSEPEFEKWRSKNTKKFTSKYFKGLGTSTAKDFKGYLQNIEKNLIKYEINDKEDTDAISLAFSKDLGKTDDRKHWLDLLE